METVQELYRALLAAWNADDAEAFAAAFADDGEVVGFDGSEMAGRAAIATELGRIFADHATGSYVGIIRSVRQIGDDAFLLRSVAGVVPAGDDDVKPELNAVQSLVASWREGRWEIDLYHNTPAQLHGRPEAAAALTEELRDQLPPDRD
ncbi:MAG TPA: SgcJ/EcaC family oxidoreductase [Baekduia sp.]|nr:SgcJ/EcaC family oxidoreductase [Baekduia sp.]